MKVLAGLGNPGSEYEDTRHNIGFMAVDRIIHRHSFSAPKEKFHGHLYEGKINGQKILLFKPMTYMNRSGIPLSELCRFLKIAPEETAVIYDELDLPLGKLRVKQGGGNNGHNGLKSIDAHFGLNYHRIRPGIDRPAVKEAVTGHVLGKFKPEERSIVDEQLAAVASCINLLVDGDIQGFMNKVAITMQAGVESKN